MRVPGRRHPAGILGADNQHPLRARRMCGRPTCCAWPLAAPVLTFASDIPLRTDIMVLRLAGARMLPFEPWKDQATLGALKRAPS